MRSMSATSWLVLLLALLALSVFGCFSIDPTGKAVDITPTTLPDIQETDNQANGNTPSGSSAEFDEVVENTPVLGKQEETGTRSAVRVVSTSDDPPEYLPYYNRKHGFTIEYPGNWEEVEQGFGAVVVFMSNFTNDEDVFQENFNIIVQDLSKNPLTLEQYTDVSKTHIAQQLYNVEYTLSEPALVGGQPGYVVHYTGYYQQYSLELMQAWTIYNDKAYVLTFTFEESVFEDFEEEANRMFATFTFS